MQVIEDEFGLRKETLQQSMSMYQIFGYVAGFKTNIEIGSQEQYEAYVQSSRDTPFVQFEVRLKLRSGPMGSVKSSQITKHSKRTVKVAKQSNMKGKILLDVNKPML